MCVYPYESATLAWEYTDVFTVYNSHNDVIIEGNMDLLSGSPNTMPYILPGYAIQIQMKQNNNYDKVFTLLHLEFRNGDLTPLMTNIVMYDMIGATIYSREVSKYYILVYYLVIYINEHKCILIVLNLGYVFTI